MDKQQRRQRSDHYRRQPIEVGIYRVRCTASQESWAGRALNLSSIQNRLWFSLRMGNHPHRPLQQAWNQHGADAFQWQCAQVLADADEMQEYERDRALTAALADVCALTGAAALR